MTRIRFRGFAAGTSTSLLSSRGGVTKGPVTISSWQTPNADPWSGSNLSETLTVTYEEIFPGGKRFAPLAMEYRIRVTNSAAGNTPDTALGTQEGSDGDRNDVSSVTLDLTTAFQAADETFANVHYVLHTGDTGNYRNARVGHPSHRSKAFEYGQNPGHVYSLPGSYTGRSIYVYDEAGAWGRVDLPDLVVRDPDEAFAPAATIVVSNDPGEDWSTAPPHNATNRCMTMNAAFARFNEIRSSETILGAGGNGVRISVKPGTSYNEYATEPNFEWTRGRTLLDTWDGGATQCTYDETGVAAGNRDRFFNVTGENRWPITVRGWRFNMGYDVVGGRPSSGWADHGTGSLLAGDHSRWTIYADSPYSDTNQRDPVIGQRIVFDNCDFEGFRAAVFDGLNPSYVARNSAYFWNDCIAKNNNDYFCFQPSNYFLTGSQLLEEYGTELGAMGRNRIGGNQRGYRGHRNIRETTCWMGYIRGSFIEARGGWSGQNDGRTYFAAQPLLRFYESSNDSLRIGKRIYICDSVLIGSHNLGRASGNIVAARVHAVMESVVHIVDPMAFNTEQLSSFGPLKAIRNCHFLCLDTPHLTTSELSATRDLSRFELSNVNIGNFRTWIEASEDGGALGRKMSLLHNTFVTLKPDAEINGPYTVFDGIAYTWNGNAVDGVANLFDHAEGHNVSYAPKLASPIGTAMSTIDMLPGVRVLDGWIKLNWERKTFNLANGVGPGQTTPPIPYPIDWYRNPTTGADYAGTSGNNAIRSGTRGDGGTTYTQLNTGGSSNLNTITVNHDLDASGTPAVVPGTGTHFTITNRHGSATWTGNFIVILDRGSTAMDPDLLFEIDPAEVKLYRPTTPQALTPGVKSTLFDFARRIRPGTDFAISPTSGTNAAGALLPA